MDISIPKTLNAECITGAVGSGKTEHLVLRLTRLLQEGVSPQEIIVFCASPAAAGAFRQRAERATSSDLTGLKVTTLQQQAAEILATPEAQAFTGRTGRILAEFEYNFLLEDLKTSGLKPRRLKEMLKFFYRGISELQNDEDGWLIHAEEEDIYRRLQQYLAFYDGMLQQEVSNLAAGFLQNSEEAREASAFEYVLVDDYQNISKASQMLSLCLAKTAVVMAGNSEESLAVFEPYPYAQGIDEFCARFEQCKRTELKESSIPQDIKAASARLGEFATQEARHTTFESLLSEAASETAEKSLTDKNPVCLSESAELCELVYEIIPDEFGGVSSFVFERMEQQGTEPDSIFIVAPNQNWCNHLARFLDSKGVPTTQFPYGQALRGDIRDSAKSATLRLYTALRLIADPNDAVSWRCWCGFNDYLTQSNTIKDLKDSLQQSKQGFIAALNTLKEAQAPLADENREILTRFIQGQSLIVQHKDLSGDALLVSLAGALDAESGLATVEQLAQPLASADTAAQLVRRIEEKLLAPCFDKESGAVRIGPPQSMCGQSPKLLVLTGFVNGFIPPRDCFDSTKTTLDKQAVLLEEYSRLLSATIGKATQQLAISYFEKTDLESAELLKLKVNRIRLEEGVKVCSITPSVFLPLIQAQ